MPKNTETFAVAPLVRLLKKGSGMRVSESAAKVMQAFLDNKTSEIGKQSTALAEHANRSTVLEKDIRLAFEQNK